MAKRSTRKPLKPESRARYLLCSDLDRTLIPNGRQPESASARPRLRALVRRSALCCVYVTGRNRALVEEAIERYDLPWPDAVIGDVGSCIWSTLDRSWRPWTQWEELLQEEWDERARDRIAAITDGQSELEPQADDRQTALKLSYFAPTEGLDRRCEVLRADLQSAGLAANVIGSFDEVDNQGLIDVLPPRASKQSAIEMLMAAWGFQHWNTVCAGDSGNDLPFLTSALQSVLVANAEDKVRERAIEWAAQRGQQANLYLARGRFLHMNGNYSAGVLEGMAHYWPEARAWME